MSDLGSTRQESEVTIAFPISFGVESLQGRLLVLSIRKFISKTIRIIAFRPPHSLSLTDDTLSLFDEMNVETIMTSPKLYYKYGDRSLRKIDFLSNGTFFENILLLGRVDKRDSRGALIMIQAGICDGDQLGTRPDVGRGMGVP